MSERQVQSEFLHPDHPDRQNVGPNPYDRTASVKEDADAEEQVGDEEVDSGLEAREAALVDKRVARDLTRSEGWVRLRDYVEEQVRLRTDKLVLEPVKAENLEEGNFMRGEIQFGRMILAYVRQMAETADATLEVFRQAEKSGDDGNTFRQ